MRHPKEGSFRSRTEQDLMGAWRLHVALNAVPTTRSERNQLDLSSQGVDDDEVLKSQPS